MVKTSKAQREATKRYQAKNDRMNIVFPAGTKARIEKVIEGRSYSTVTQFIKQAVLENLDIEEKFIEFEKNP